MTARSVPRSTERTADSTLQALDPDHEDTSLPALVSRRFTGHHRIDEWGYDSDLVVAWATFAALRWAVEVEHAERVPEVGGAVLVYNRRLGPAEPLVMSTAIGRTIGRPVRFAGIDDGDPLSPLLRRLGGVPRQPDDLRVLLRAGEVVAVPLRRKPRPWIPFGSSSPATAPRKPIVLALELGLPVIPLAIQGFDLSRRRRVRIGEPIVTRRRRSVVGIEELSVSVGERVRELVDSAEER